MFYINDEEIKLIKENIFVGKYTKNNVGGYNINIDLEFLNKGYLHLSAGLSLDNSIDNFFNKKYSGVPFDSDDADIFFEVFTGSIFLDTEIESPIIIVLKNKVSNKVKSFFEVNDELIHIKYDGYLEII